MRKIIKSKGLIIKVQDYLENAVLATILTENGKESIIIKGAKKLNTSTRRLGNVLTLIEYNHTESSGLSVLTEGVVVDNYTLIKDELLKFNYALVMLEKINFFIEEFTDYKTLYNFTISLLNKLKETSYLNAVVLIFQIKILYLLGVAPSFNRCPVCGKKAINAALDIKSGGFICEDCHYLKETSLNIEDSKLFKEIYVTKVNDFNDELLIKIDNHININKCVKSYYEWHLDFKSKVLDIIEKIG
ncbi:MAG: DNA repair protein RecO [Bacilli bacterium]|nr:DNA repair protein RecO [Bacilli bacterium]